MSGKRKPAYDISNKGPDNCTLCGKPHHPFLPAEGSMTDADVRDLVTHIFIEAFGPIGDRHEPHSAEWVDAYARLAEVIGYLGGCIQAKTTKQARQDLIDELVYAGPGTYIMEVSPADGSPAFRRLN